MRNLLLSFAFLVIVLNSYSCKQKAASVEDETIVAENDSDELNLNVQDIEPPSDDAIVPPQAEADKTSTKTSTTKQSSTQTEMLHGTMMVKGGEWIIRSGDGGEQRDYFPTNLEDDFKVEGLSVGFQGILQEIPKNVRMVGAPIELTKIIRMEIKN